MEALCVVLWRLSNFPCDPVSREPFPVPVLLSHAGVSGAALQLPGGPSGHTSRAGPAEAWQSLCTWDLKGHKYSKVGQQGLAQYPYNLTVLIDFFFVCVFQNFGGSARNSPFSAVFCIGSWNHLEWKNPLEIIESSCSPSTVKPTTELCSQVSYLYIF